LSGSLLEETKVVAVVVDERLALVVAVAMPRASFKVENSLPWAITLVVHACHFKILHVTSTSIIIHEEDFFVRNIVIKLVALLVSSLIAHRAVCCR